MNPLPCVTTTMRGRPCVILGEHVEACVWAQMTAEAERRGIPVAVVDRERTDLGLPTARACRGCVPRPAEHGLLCDSCYPKFEDALKVAVGLITHLRSVERGAQSVDGVRVAQGSKVIVPASWLAADSLWADLAELAFAHARARRLPEPEWPVAAKVIYGGRSIVDGWFDPTATLDQVAAAVRDLVGWLAASPELVVASLDGATAAVTFFRHLQTQLHRFPMDDTPVARPLLRCRRCSMFAVREHPPLDYLAERVLRCDVCEHEQDPLLIDWNLKLYAEEVWGAMTAEQRANLLPSLDVDERRVLRDFARTDVEVMRAKVWERLGAELGAAARVLWFNTPRPEWGDLTADLMIEAGRGDEVLAAIGVAA